MILTLLEYSFMRFVTQESYSSSGSMTFTGTSAITWDSSDTLKNV